MSSEEGMSGDEYTEEDVDLDALLEDESYLDESSQNSMIDLDVLLARPSESQLAAEDELDRRALAIR